MKKVDFLAELRLGLSGFSKEEQEEIVRDQEEYIREAVSAGREEDAVIASLGDPRAFATQLKVQSKIDRVESSKRLPEQMQNVTGAVLAIMALAPFNVIFVLGPFIGIVSILFSGWLATLAILLGALVALLVFVSKLVFFGVGFYTHLSAFFLCVGVSSLGILGIYIMLAFTRFFVKATVTYLRWNLKLIEGKV